MLNKHIRTISRKENKLIDMSINKSLSMSQLFHYAWRSFLRNKRKNIILIITVAMGIISFIFLSSFLKGSDEQSVKAVITHESGEIQVLHPNYFDDPLFPIDDTIAFPQSVQDSLATQGWKASPQQRFFVNIVLPSPPYAVNGTIRHTVLAVDFSRDTYYQDILSSSLQKKSQNTNSIAELLQGDSVVISAWLANQISAKVGYPLILVTKGKGGFFEQLELEITGIIDTTYPQLDRAVVFMSYETANNYVLLDNEYTTINFIKHLQVPSENTLSLHKEQIQEAFSQENVSSAIAKSWRDIQVQRYQRVIWEYPQSLSLIYLVFIFIIAAAGMTSNTSMNIISRHKEIGTMQAFGMTKQHIMILYTMEMCLVGIIASIVACISGIGLMALLVNKGLDYSIFFQESTFGYPSSGILKGSWNYLALLQGSCIGIGFTTTLGFFIVWRMKKQYSNVIEMLRART